MSERDDRPESVWDAIEAHVSALDETRPTDADSPDPWADTDVDVATLTEDQIAFLQGLDDQPPVPRLDRDEGFDDEGASGDPTG